jgi:hypothetical protein
MQHGLLAAATILMLYLLAPGLLAVLYDIPSGV